MRNLGICIRLTVLMMLIIQLIAFAYFENAVIFSLIIFLIIPLSSFEKLNFTFPEKRKTFILLLIAIPFAIHWFLFPYNPDNAYFLHPMTHSFAHYFILLQLLQLFYKDNSISVLTPLYGTLVIIASGNFFSSAEIDALYSVIATAFAVFSLLFYRFTNFFNSNTTHFNEIRLDLKKNKLKYITLFTIIFISSISAGILGYNLQQNKHDIDHFMFGLTSRLTGIGGGNFSDSCKIGSISAFRNGFSENKTVLRIYSKKYPEYFRGMVYSSYSNSRWSSKKLTSKNLRPSKRPPWIKNKFTKLNFYKLSTLKKSFFTFEVWNDSSLEMNFFTPKDINSLISSVEQIQLSSDYIIKSTSKKSISPYTLFVSRKINKEKISKEQSQLYKNISSIKNKKIKKIADKIFKNCSTFNEKIVAVENYFHTNYKYKIGIDVPRGRRPLEYFLFEKPPAHCEFFATATVILLRMADIPARYVTGFIVTEKNPVGDYWMARNKDAHAWVEAYSPESGWITVEPTPSAGIPSAKKDTWTLTYIIDLIFANFNSVFHAFKTYGFKKAMGILVEKILYFFLYILKKYYVFLIVIIVLMLIYFILKIKRKSSVHEVTYSNNKLTPLLKKIDTKLAGHGVFRKSDETIFHFSSRLIEHGLDKKICSQISDWYMAYSKNRYRKIITDESVQQLSEKLDIIIRLEIN